MDRALIIVDMQEGFKNKNTKKIFEKINKEIDKGLLNKYALVYMTKYINNKYTPCYKQLGWEELMTKKDQAIEKEVYDKIKDNYKISFLPKEKYSCRNEWLINELIDYDIGEIDICGFDTDCCVLTSALDMFDEGFKVRVIENMCASSKKEYHKKGIDILKRMIGKKNIIKI